jgi:zinc transporter 1/2/3
VRKEQRSYDKKDVRYLCSVLLSLQRVGAIFILLASSAFTTLFPVITKRSPKVNIPGYVFEGCKYFGSGVIIATAFIHLLAPGSQELSSPCLSSAFQNYDFAFAFSMIAVFATFLVELVAFRVGAQYAQSLAYDPHVGGHHHAAEHHSSALSARHEHGNDSNRRPAEQATEEGDKENSITNGGSDVEQIGDLQKYPSQSAMTAAASEILGVAILEFGVIFREFIREMIMGAPRCFLPLLTRRSLASFRTDSVIIGITLGTTNDFTILFIVIIFHQMFEGLGLGTRLALLPLNPTSWIPYLGAVAYALVTPLGVAIGLAVRTSYNEDSATANYVTGTFDSISSGILLYTGLVELLAHEFIFNEKMRKAPLAKVFLAIGQMLAGAGIMALLGRWA